MTTVVEIEKARELGFCFGVRRAIKIVEKAAKEHQDVATLGPIVHNRLVVARLNDMGIGVIGDLNQIKGKAVAISSHGASPQLLSQIKDRQLQIIDTTCPTVRSAQRAIKKLAESGFGIVIFGESAHPEVKGLLGWADNKAIATLNGADLGNIELPKRLGILSQTTQGRPQFAEFVRNVINAVYPGVKEIRIINTLCEETQKRQAAALELARKSDVMLVVGGRNSANTKRLAEICSPIVATHLIETAAEIEKDWLSGKKHIGVTAGTSTPDEAIDEVVARLKELTGSPQ
jgi:4-hydroxy-3-methylbut-2-enyl diphosphate reductase